MDALDELIIVVQESLDSTLEIAKKYQAMYPKKIKLFEYPVEVDNPLYYERNQPSVDRNSYYKRAYTVHGAANYYNFTQSKVSYKYTMKIDADQIYITNKLDFIRKFYKNDTKGWLTYFIKSILKPKKIKYLLTLSKLIKDNNNTPTFIGSMLYKYANKIYTMKNSFSVLMNNNQSLSLIGFSGYGDHCIYLSNKHYYILSEEYLYEVIKPYPSLFFLGFLFIHLHGVKKNYYERFKLLDVDIKKEFARNFSTLIEFKDYVNLTYPEMSEVALKRDVNRPVFTKCVRELKIFWNYERYELNKLYNKYLKNL